MIGRLSGTLVYKKPPELLLDVQGVGYEIQASMNTFYHLPTDGQPAVLWTHLSIREDAHVLFGFFTPQERELFRTLIKVNGVGPKSALSILSSITPEEFLQTIASQDADRLVKVPGIGKKTAERLMIEMRDCLNDLYTGSATENLNANPSAPTAALPKTGRIAQQEALSALVALGYKPQEASRVVHQLDNLEQLDSEAIIRGALKRLMK